MSAVEVRTTAATTSVRRLPSTRFLRSELKVIFGRRRNQGALVVVGLVPIMIAVAVRVSSSGGGGGPSFISAITGNGLFVALAALTVELAVLLPLVVAAVSADAVAGEANLGTLRYLLTVPVGRSRLLAVKYAAVVIFTFVATLTVAVVGVIIGLALFGGGPMTLLSGTQIGMGEALARLLLVTVYLTLGLAALAAIGLFVSTLTEQPIAATIVIVVLNVLSVTADSIQQLAWLHPWLVTHWWTSFGDLLRDPMVWDGPLRGLAVAAGYAVVFWLAAWARFSSKDITA